MLGTLREVSKRGGNIIAINPIKERGLERFQDPQAPLEMMTNGSTPISRYYFQPKIGGDYALMLGMLKHLNEWDKKQLPPVNRVFLIETLLRSIRLVSMK